MNQQMTFEYSPVKKLTQEEKIMRAFKNYGRKGIHPTYLIGELKIYQYNARIKGLRDKMGCVCIHGENLFCKAKEHIINVQLKDGTTKFFYPEAPILL